jgi:hypothetical protein
MKANLGTSFLRAKNDVPSLAQLVTLEPVFLAQRMNEEGSRVETRRRQAMGHN